MQGYSRNQREVLTRIRVKMHPASGAHLHHSNSHWCRMFRKVRERGDCDSRSNNRFDCLMFALPFLPIPRMRALPRCHRHPDTGLGVGDSAICGIPPDHTSVQARQRHSMHIIGAYPAQRAVRYFSVYSRISALTGRYRVCACTHAGLGVGRCCPIREINTLHASGMLRCTHCSFVHPLTAACNSSAEYGEKTAEGVVPVEAGS